MSVFASVNTRASFLAVSFPAVSFPALMMLAGLVALANQVRANASESSLDGPSQTLPRLYNLPTAAYHDITTGNNGFPATAGYDLVTGIGGKQVLIEDPSGNPVELFEPILPEAALAPRP